MKKLPSLLSYILIVCCPAFAQAATKKLVLTGSSTIAPLAAELGRAFEELKGHPSVRIDVQMGGSSRGIADALRGRADIGMVSRNLEPNEGVLAHPLARDGIAMITHSSNLLTGLTRNQVLNIYLGKIRSWKELGGEDIPIVRVHKASGRSTQEIFLKYLGVPNSQIKADIIIGDNQQGIKTVSGLKGAIGYVSIGTAVASTGAQIRLIPIDSIEPTFENVKKGVYPLSRTLNFVTKAKPSGVAQDFLKFAHTDAALKIIESQSFVPIKP